MKILVVNGPNLNLLGERETEIYGSMTLAKLNILVRKYASKSKIQTRFFQSNSEGQLIDSLHKNRKWADGVLINPGAYTHYSYALRDALVAIQKPFVEVHLSDIHKREDFRKFSVLTDVCLKQISGLGSDSYLRGLDHLADNLRRGA